MKVSMFGHLMKICNLWIKNRSAEIYADPEMREIDEKYEAPKDLQFCRPLYEMEMNVKHVASLSR